MLEDYRVEFEVHAIHEYKKGMMLLGRCVDGKIRLNDSFLFLYELKYQRVEGNLNVVGYQNLDEINLKVQEIECYQQSVKDLVKGYSGGIYVIGSNLLERQPSTQLQITNVLPGIAGRNSWDRQEIRTKK